jgi:hypothetical protein
MRRALRFCILAGLAGSGLGCSTHPRMAQIDGVTLPECDETVPAADGPTFAFWAEAHEEQYTLPKAPVVRIAADRGVSWRRVKQIEDRLRAQGSTPVLLCGVGSTDRIAAFAPTQPLDQGKHLSLWANLHGDFFVGEPDGDKGTHVQAFDNEHIAKSFIRETMSPMVAKYGVHDVEVHVDPHIQWADMVRAIDGSRTCCEGIAVRASLVE